MVIEEIKVKYPEIKVDEIQTIETVELTGSNQYTFVAPTTQGTLEQIELSLVKETNEIRYTGLIPLDINMEEPVLVQPAVMPSFQVPS